MSATSSSTTDATLCRHFGTCGGCSLQDKSYDAAAWLVLGYNLKFSGDPEGARRAFERVAEIDPGQEAARTFLRATASRPTTESRPESR